MQQEQNSRIPIGYNYRYIESTMYVRYTDIMLNIL